MVEMERKRPLTTNSLTLHLFHIIRYLIVYYFGGVYADSDVNDFVPIKNWECWQDDEVRIAVGIESEVKDEADRRRQRYTHYTQFMQWTFVK